MDNDVKKAGYGLAEFLILSVICLFIAFETVQLLLPQLFLLTRFLWQSEYTMTAFVCLVIILAMAEFRLFKWIQKMLHQILYKYDKKKTNDSNGVSRASKNGAQWIFAALQLLFPLVLMAFEASRTEPESRIVCLFYLGILEIILVRRVFLKSPESVSWSFMAVRLMVLVIVTVCVLRFGAAGIYIVSSIPLSPWPGLSSSAWFGLWMANAVSVLLITAWMQDLLAEKAAGLAVSLKEQKFASQIGLLSKRLLLILSCALVLILMETVLVNVLPWICIELAGFSSAVSRMDLLALRQPVLSFDQDLFIYYGLGGAWIFVSALITRAEIAAIKFAGIKIRSRMR